MGSRQAIESIIEGLSTLLEGYVSLRESLELEFGAEENSEEDLEDTSSAEEVESNLITELKAGLDSVMVADDYAPEEMAALLTSLSDALEEIDPDAFESIESEDDFESIEDDEDDADDDELYEDDDDYYDDDDEFDSSDDDDY